MSVYVDFTHCPHCDMPLIASELCDCQETCGIDPEDRDWSPEDETYPSRA